MNCRPVIVGVLCFALCMGMSSCKGKKNTSSTVAETESFVSDQSATDKNSSKVSDISSLGVSAVSGSRQASSSKKNDKVSSSNPVPNSKKPSQAASQLDSVPLRPIDSERYYGKQLLKKTGSAAENAAYNAFVEQIGNYQKTVVFDFDLTIEEAKKAYSYYRDDWPQHFWRGNQYHFSARNNKVVTMTFSDITETPDQLRQKMQRVTAQAEAILSQLSASMSEFERERLIHDAIINKVRFDTTLKAPDAHDLYGALVNGKAVCEGYAAAFQYLMRQAGIQCIVAKGTLTQGGQSVNHAWNMAEIAGQFYHVDVTADDPVISGFDDVLKFNYFNVTQQRILRDHTLEDNAYPLPSATSEKHEFFNRNELVFDTLSVDAVARAYVYSVRHGYAFAHLRLVSGRAEETTAYLQRNLYSVVDRANEMLGEKKIETNGQILVITDSLNNICSIKL